MEADWLITGNQITAGRDIPWSWEADMLRVCACVYAGLCGAYLLYDCGHKESDSGCLNCSAAPSGQQRSTITSGTKLRPFWKKHLYTTEPS